MRRHLRQYIIALIAYSGQIGFGFTVGWTSPVFQNLQEDPDLLGNLTEGKKNWLASGVALGTVFSTIPLGWMSNSIGRKPTLIIAGAINLACYIFLATIFNADAVIFFRTGSGFSAGMILVLNLVYLGEIASTEIRGLILGMTGLFISFGVLLVYTLGHYLPYHVLNYIGAAFGLVYLLGTIFILLESPVFLLRKGKDTEAKATLLALNRKEDAEDMAAMKKQAEATKQNVKWSQLIAVKCNRKALFITITLYILQQFSGSVPLLSYTTTVFNISGSLIPPFLATIYVGIVQVLSGMITPLYIERYGRRKLLLWSTFFSCVSLAILSAYLYLANYGNPIVEKMKWLPLTALITHFLAYGFGFGIIPATLVGEMFELNMRAPGTALVLLVNFSSGFAVVLLFGFLVSSAGLHVAFAMFSAACALAFVFTILFVPETKGKTLFEVQRMLS